MDDATGHRMDAIESVDANSSVATVQSGVVLERLDSALRSDHGLMVPLDLGAKVDSIDLILHALPNICTFNLVD